MDAFERWPGQRIRPKSHHSIGREAYEGQGVTTPPGAHGSIVCGRRVRETGSADGEGRPDGVTRKVASSGGAAKAAKVTSAVPRRDFERSWKEEVLDERTGAMKSFEGE